MYERFFDLRERPFELTTDPRFLYRTPRRAAGEAFALVIDEAQAMSLTLLEEVRLLGNMESETDRLLPIVLTGQPEFATMLAQPPLLPLRQRIALRCTVGPFDVAETA